MPKHIVDKDHTAGNNPARTKAYAGIEKSEQPSAASLEAQRAERTRGKNARLQAFTRIERENA